MTKDLEVTRVSNDMDNNTEDSKIIKQLKQRLPAIYDNWLQTRMVQPSNEINDSFPAVNTLPRTFVLSVSDGYGKAKIFSFILDDLATTTDSDASHNYANFEKILPILVDRINKLSAKFAKPLVWLRLEWLNQITPMTWLGFQKDLKRFKRNYYRSGIAFTGVREPWLLLTEMELNANACLYAGNTVTHAKVNVNNLNTYLRARHGSSQLPDFSDELPLISFNTSGVFIDVESDEYHNLETKSRNKGHRILPALSAETTQPIIEMSTNYLSKQVQPSGQYIYGHFPCFGRTIDTYNSLRHASSTYALIEGYEACRNFDSNAGNGTDAETTALVTASASPAKLTLSQMQSDIDKAMGYLTHQLIQTYDDKAYVVDTGGEIKLGANAVAILALVKYLQVFTDTPKAKEYHALAEKLALGIIAMQQEDGSFVHVLHSKDLTLKAKHRIIYYDGEAAFAMMRLYGLTKDERWIDCVTRAFDYFIAAKHDQAHDHWLSYCSNELIIYKPEKKYFQFAVDNVKGYTNFIKSRITTFPTLLELSMAFHNMLLKLDEHPEFQDVLNGFDVQEFYEALHARANHLLNGFFFPEMAMFYKLPQTILHGFFIRHHSFRVRIDDVEHYLSGLIAYQKMLSQSKVTIEPNKDSKSEHVEKSQRLIFEPSIQTSKDTSTIAWGGDINLGRRQHYLTKRYGIDKVLDIAALKDADFTIVNLECVVSTLGEQGRAKGEGGSYYYRARPEMVEILRHAGVDAVACANNHSGDYGPEALLQQKEVLTAVGIDSVGTGKTKENAFAPIYHQLPNGIKIAVFNVDATIKHFAVTDEKAGAAYIDPKSHNLWTDTYTPLFRLAKQKADLVLVAIHWGANSRATPDDNEIEIGHRLIDAGADAILGASAHQLQGVEIYKSKPIIHDAGDLLFDAVVSKSKPKVGGVFQLEVEPKGIKRIMFYPLDIGFGQTQAIAGDQAITASRDFATMCIAMGTIPNLHEDGRLSIDIEPSLVRSVSKNQIVSPNPILDNQSKDIDYSQWSAKTRTDLIVDEVPEDARIDPINFGAMQLIGVRTHPYFFNRRRMLWVESFWRINEAITDDMRIHFRARPTFQTNKMRPWGIGTDHDPCDWLLPTSSWEPGKIYRDFYGLRPPYRNAWEDGSLQLEVSVLDRDKRHNFVELPFEYVLNIHRMQYADNLAKHMHYRNVFLDEVYENHTQGTWNAEQITAITRGKWLVAPPNGWYIDSFAAAGEHVGLATGRVMFVANSNDNRAAHENYTKKPRPLDRHTKVLELQDDLAGAIVDHYIEGLDKNFPLLQVKDPIKAWMELGIAARSRFSKPVIAVTGTVGKSSTCNMIETMFGRDRHLLNSIANYNSRVGALGMLANLSLDHDAAIIEVAQSALWMNRGPVTRFVRPNVALITEIGISQIEMVKTLENAVRFKCKVFDGLAGDSIAVIGAHLPHFDQVLGYAREHAKKIIIYGDHSDSEIRIKNIKSDYSGSQVDLETNRGDYSFFIPMPTEGMAKSAIAAFTVMYALGEDLDKVCQNISQYQSIEGRLETYDIPVLGGDVTIVDDNWNALYSSMVNALSLFGTQKDDSKRFIFVLGRLVDLGDKTKEMHQSLSVPILKSKPDLVVTHGEEMKHLREVLPKEMLGEHFDDVNELAKYLKGLWRADDVILIKGSRTGSDFVKIAPLLRDING